MSELDEAWSLAIEVDCPECGAKALQRCVNPIFGNEKKVPCWRREKASRDTSDPPV